MNGHVQKRNGHWRIVIEYGEQTALQCPTCRKRYWSDDAKPRTCPEDHGELEETVARRQDMLPAKYATKKPAEKAMRDELQEREHGTWVAPVDMTTGEYLRETWLPALDAEELAPSTVDAYKLNVRRIVPYVGRIPLQKLSRNDVAKMSAQLATDKSKRKGKPLSAETRRAILVVLHRALNDAVAAGLLRANPAAGVKRPKVRRAEMHTWTGTELSTFLRATRTDRLGTLWHLLAMTGLRRGEALGLQWSDADLEGGRLSIQRQRVLSGYKVEERQTKTNKARAVSVDVGTVGILRQQAAQQLADADEWGDAWQDTGHIFTRENGEPWHPDRITKLFDEVVEGVKVPRIRLHDLRHTWATLALRTGVHPKVVQERLGHANIGITMDTYSHVLPDMQESAAEMVAALVDLSDAGDEG